MQIDGLNIERGRNINILKNIVTPSWNHLKNIDYKKAWQQSWENTTDEDRKKVFALPNFDAKIFEEITGIKVYEKYPEEL